MNILDTIVAAKVEEVARRKTEQSLSFLKDQAIFQRTPISISARLSNTDDLGIIAEFKRKSPSKPTINLEARIEDIVGDYQKAGVAGISILTDHNFFGGSSKDLIEARALLDIPILRKDFIIDPYQIFEAKSIGADFILLIAEILSKTQVNELSSLAHELGMEVLMEMHSFEEVDKAGEHVDILGINNRNLKTFTTDIQFSLDQYEALPSDKLKISESGIHTPEAIHLLKAKGYNGFLIGERFMSTKNPGSACQQFINSIQA